MAINTVCGIFSKSVGVGGPLETTAATKTQPLPGSGQPDRPIPEVDQVRLTPASLSLRQLETNRDEPPIDRVRVAELRAAIERGDYQVDPDRVAQKLLELENSLFP